MCLSTDQTYTLQPQQEVLICELTMGRRFYDGDSFQTSFSLQVDGRALTACADVLFWG